MRNKRKYFSLLPAISIIVVIIFTLFSISFSEDSDGEGGSGDGGSVELKIFPHWIHKENEIGCSECHPNVTKSEKAGDNNSPEGAICRECHDEAGFADRVDIKTPEPPVMFNHSLHIEDMEQKCTTCHVGIYDKKFVKGIGIPEMGVCLKCHNGEDAPKNCSFCHESPPMFSHLTHKKNEVECESCHTTVKESKSPLDNNLPKANICDDCHDKEFAQGVAVFDAFIPIAFFNHNKHIIEQEVPCLECHGAIMKRGFKYGQGFPYMSKCMECHEDGEMSRCVLCHNKIAGKPISHFVEWRKNHRSQARTREKECLSCHGSVKFCVDCHKGSIMPRWHAQNFINTHKIDVKFKMVRCSSCHGSNFCSDCHAKYKVSFKKGRDAVFHPDGWLDKNSPNFHKIKGRRSFHTCNKCHRKSDCIICHKQ